MVSNDKPPRRGPLSAATLRVHIEPSVPDPPAWLQGDALVEWDRVVAILGEAGLLTELDQSILAAYCQATVIHRRASELLEAEGLITETTVRGTIRRSVHPANQVLQAAWAAIEKFAKVLGLDPTSRGRMAMSQPPPVKAGVMTRQR